MNPCAGKTDLPDFESGPFNHLGTTPERFGTYFGTSKAFFIILFYVVYVNAYYLAVIPFFCIITSSMLYKKESKGGLVT